MNEADEKLIKEKLDALVQAGAGFVNRAKELEQTKYDYSESLKNLAETNEELQKILLEMQSLIKVTSDYVEKDYTEKIQERIKGIDVQLVQMDQKCQAFVEVYDKAVSELRESEKKNCNELRKQVEKLAELAAEKEDIFFFVKKTADEIKDAIEKDTNFADSTQSMVIKQDRKIDYLGKSLIELSKQQTEKLDTMCKSVKLVKICVLVSVGLSLISVIVSFIR